MARYRGHPKPFLTDVMTSGAMADIVETEAEHIADVARSIAPWYEGDYSRSIHTRTEIDTNFAGGPRVVGVAVAGTDHAIPVEMRHKTMQRALGSA